MSGEQGEMSFGRGMKILNQNPNQNALDYLAWERSFRRIASLEIRTKIQRRIRNKIRQIRDISGRLFIQHPPSGYYARRGLLDEYFPHIQ